VAIKGSLKEASLADVCQLLSMGQKTGCLSITDRSRFGQIYFERGRITFARIVNRRDRLGDLLVREGRLSEQQLRDVLEVQARDPDRRVGELLVANGFLTHDELSSIVRVQIEEAIYHLFTWSRGAFFFEVDERPEFADILVSINPESLLLEAARRIDEWSLIQKKIPTFDLLFEVEDERLRASDVELTSEQKQILPLLDGRHTIQDLVDITGVDEFDVGKGLFGLIQAGFAHRVGRRAEADAAPSREAETNERRNLGIAFFRAGMFEDAAREFRRVLELFTADAHARYHLALIALRDGRQREGLRELKRLVEELGPRYGAFVNMAHALRKLGRTDDALLALDEAELLRPRTAEVPLLRAAALLDRGDVEAARAALAEHRTRLPHTEDPPARYFYFATLAAGLAGRLNEAEATIAEGVDCHPTAPMLLLAAGAVAERRGNLDAAERYYRLASEEAPALAHPHRNLGDLAYRRGRHDDAVDLYRRALELDPDLGDETYFKLGNLLFKRSERADAVHCWQRALELNPANAVVRTNLEMAARAG
jgi:tetratricopeptide (TPR) repeat protein